MLNISAFFISQELKRRGYSVTTFADNDLLLIQKFGRSLYTHASKVLLDSSGYLICKDKSLAKLVLDHFGFPTARGKVITVQTVSESMSLQIPLALKPLRESGGTDIHLNVVSTTEIMQYFLSHPQYSEVLVEEMLLGEDTRILVVGGKFFAACQRKPAFVVGDGTHTIRELVEIENSRRDQLHYEQQEKQTYLTNLERIRFDEESLYLLRSQSRTENDVPRADEVVLVRQNANVTTGGIAVDVTDQVCTEIRQMSEALAQALSLPLVGIDILTSDLHRPLDKREKSGIIEINGSPSIGLHTLVDVGEKRDPTPLLVDMIDRYFST